MTNEETKLECEKQYEAIAQAKIKLAAIRQDCDHTETVEGIWSWREGHYRSAIICSSCGSLVRYMNDLFEGVTTTFP